MPHDEIDTQTALLLARRFSMAGRRALVTGGSVSIGREIVRVFAEAGADVAVHSARAADIAFGQPDAEIHKRGGAMVARAPPVVPLTPRPGAYAPGGT